jgi:hypothetical protein
MIHFKPEVEICQFTYEIIPVALNASMWGYLSSIGVCIWSITYSLHHGPTDLPWSISVDMDTDAATTEPRERLYAYLKNYLPVGFDVTLAGDHVNVTYCPRPRAKAKGNA